MLEQAPRAPSPPPGAARPLPSLAPRADAGSLRAKLRAVAQQRALETRGGATLSDAGVRAVWEALEEQAAAMGDPGRINYDGFSQVATRCHELLGGASDSIFRASNFLRFEADASGAISVQLFMQYASQRAAVAPLRGALLALDAAQRGSLDEGQVQRFVAAALPQLACLADMPVRAPGAGGAAALPPLLQAAARCARCPLPPPPRIHSLNRQKL
jgi:hypothetical protein